MDDFDLEIKTEFINEALTNLEESEGAFLELESSADPKPLLDRIFRLAHNLKGGSRAVGFGDVAEFTHQLENLVLKIQNSEVKLNGDVVSTLLRSNDRLIEMLSSLKGNLAATFENADLLTEINSWLSGRVSEDVAPQKISAETPNEVGGAITSALQTDSPVSIESQDASIESTDSGVTDIAEDSLENAPPAMPDSSAFFAGTEVADETKSALTPPLAEAKAEVASSIKSEVKAEQGKNQSDTKAVQEDEVVRVSLSRINLLNDFVGEMIVLQSVVQQQAESGNAEKMLLAVQQLSKLSKDIQGISMSLRMLPVKPLIQKLQRVVRDTAKALDREVELDVVGESMEIDKSVLDRLADPLIHILRNGVDHGIESRDIRKAAGKESRGRIVLSLVNEGNNLIVEVKDDGKGIDPEVLRKKAIEKRLISESQAMTEKQLIHLIFHPGFSTKAVTSEISGRGVGMDVVKTNVEQIGGVVDVTSKVGHGSVFRIQIPLSLSVIEGIVVASGNGRYVVPLTQVEETINLKSFKKHEGKKGTYPCIDLRGKVVPLLGLEETLSGQANANDSEGETALVVDVDGHLIGVRVKEILRAQQIVIKPLGGALVPQRGWIGTCVLGDGLPTLIVSLEELLRGRVNFAFTVSDIRNLGGAA